MLTNRPIRLNPRQAHHSSLMVRLSGAAVVSSAMSASVMVTAGATESTLGAPLFWTWILTGLQVVAMWSAGTHRWWGWLLGASVQPPWITYAAVTGQLGFIPGCLFSVAVQMYTFMRPDAPSPKLESRLTARSPITTKEVA